jgi:O-antigen ligase
MPPILATILTLSGVVWLFRRDFRERPNVSAALWLPFFWIFISGSRFVTDWIGILTGAQLGGTSVEEGSMVDALFYFAMIAGGLQVLNRRRINWSQFRAENQWVVIYLGYCLVSCLWSDYPFVSVKRWIKLFGQPVMVLVLLTEPNPLESFTRLMKRFGYIVVPVSVLFIKYYPELGSCYDSWTGQRMNTGITTDKNALGSLSFALGLFFVWHAWRVWRWEKSSQRTWELCLCAGFMVVILYLFQTAHSSSPIGAFMMAMGMMALLGLKVVNHRQLSGYLVVGIIATLIGVWGFHLDELVIQMLGRNKDLTGRTEIWGILWNWDFNRVIGVGFESFWIGPRLDALAVYLPGLPLNQAHNGYLETLIQIGGVGVLLTIALLLATYFKAHRSLLAGEDFARYRLAYLAAFTIYNFTEALFRTTAFPFFLFFLVAIDYTIARPDEPSEVALADEDEAEEGVHKTSNHSHF